MIHVLSRSGKTPCGGAVSRSYSTSFPNTENPISESGNWVNGGTTGLDWNDMQCASGKAWGNQGNGTARDGTALLQTGTWAANQYGQGTVYILSPPASNSPEVEIRLRSSISAHVNNGYEISFGCQPGTAAYIIIVRWNGAQGDFTELAEQVGSGVAIATGDVVRAEISGNIITAYINGTSKLTADITALGGTVFSSGAPGMGHNSEESGGADNNKYGFTAYSAGEL